MILPESRLAIDSTEDYAAELTALRERVVYLESLTRGKAPQQAAFDKQLNDSETVDAIDDDDVTKLLRDAVRDAFVPARKEEDGYFCGSYLGAGRGYKQHDTLTVAFHLGDSLDFSEGGVDWIAERIDSWDGNAVMYEVRRA